MWLYACMSWGCVIFGLMELLQWVRLNVLFVAAPHRPAEPCAGPHSAGALHLPEVPAVEVLLSGQGEWFMYVSVCCVPFCCCRYYAHSYLWWELPQVLFLSCQTFCRDKDVFVVTKHIFCHDKSMLVMTKVLSSQNGVCRDKIFLWQNVCRDKHTFVATKLLSQPTCVCCERYLSWQILSQQAYSCHDKRRALSWQTHVSHNKHHNKTIVPTKMILVAAPANHTQLCVFDLEDRWSQGLSGLFLQFCLTFLWCWNE